MSQVRLICASANALPLVEHSRAHAQHVREAWVAFEAALESLGGRS